MFVFAHQTLLNGSFEFAIARKNRNQYFLVLCMQYGLIGPHREISHLNVSTQQSLTPLPLSIDGRPCIWLDCSSDREKFSLLPNPVILNALLNAEPRPIIKLCGLTRHMPRPSGEKGRYLEGDVIEIEKVELLLSEDELAHSCYYCSEVEMYGGKSFERIGGQAYVLPKNETGYSRRRGYEGGARLTSTYGCAACMSKPWISRALSGVRKYWENTQ